MLFIGAVASAAISASIAGPTDGIDGKLPRFRLLLAYSAFRTQRVPRKKKTKNDKTIL